MDSRLPGYLIIEAKGASAEIGSLTAEVLASLGEVLAKAEGLLISTFQPYRVITAKLGFSLGYSCHFHMVPISHEFLNEIQAHPSYTNEPDGNDALLFASREYCERPLNGREQEEQFEIVKKLRAQELTNQSSKGPSGRDSLTLAPATREHASGIAKVHIRSWQAAYAGILDQAFLDQLSIGDRALRWEDILQKQESKTLVALRDDRVVGFISYGHWRQEQASPEQGEIWALYAEPQSWSQGVGRALMAQALRELRAHGYVEVSLWVISRNERGINFYKSCGFSHVEGSEKQFELGGRQIEEVCLRLRNDA